MAEPALFVATPLATPMVHCQWAAGAMRAMVAFRDRIAIQTLVGSFLPITRDKLTKAFLDSAATHMLCVDSDIGWTPEDAQRLLDTGHDFVSGVYCKKTPRRELPINFTNESIGELSKAHTVPAGFLLLSRACIERMIGAYRDLQYKTDDFGYCWALWSSLYSPGVSYDGEDVAFCRRWTRVGGDIWVHRGVVLNHFGDHGYTPVSDMISGLESRSVASNEAASKTNGAPAHA